MKKLELLVNGKSYNVEVIRTGGEVARVIVNGSPYDVVIKDLPEGHFPQVRTTAEKAAQAAAVGFPPAQMKHEFAAAEGVTVVKSPLPGLILDVKTGVGDSVNAGDTLVVIETMKMENNVVSPVSGVVKEIKVSKDQTVNEGVPLIVIGPLSPFIVND
ncbi:acetyl-CoA carboxylase biotin carboxyl carrier protein subunit [Candidatus Poribacteria bacterium]|nr:acetyl-CoA carboxylase biotin carboxyl carrier protein subunit [Candidatus Poribacteria bacterium]